MDASLPLIISRANARSAGLPRYFTDKPCSRGHVADRDTGHGKCVECEKARSTDRYRADPGAREYHKEKLRKLRLDPVKRAREASRNLARRHADLRRCLVWGARARAKKLGRAFVLTVDDVPEIPAVCPVLGIPIFFAGKKHTDNSPTLDRIDSRLGYVRGNVAVISMRANKLKSDATPDEMLRLSQWMAAHQSSNTVQQPEIPVL
jgi:hypothetical protein